MHSPTCLTSDYIINQLPKIISLDKYQDYLTNKYIKQLNQITNLTQINSKCIEELCPVLNHLISRNIFYINSGKILLSINPGPFQLNNSYFNLKEWYESISLLPFDKWSPHIYTVAHSCYTQMIEQNKDQAIVVQGSLGAGKSFNAHKVIQYLFFISSPSNFNKETYEVINKGIKLMNMISSIYKRQNLNSSSSGVVYHIGFTPSNEIASFDIDSEILDCTLPFSENGRSFTLLHGFALTHLDLFKFRKKSYNFFLKYISSFPKEVIVQFNKKDIEAWETFEDHCRIFLTEREVKEITVALELIILFNEITLFKTRAIVNKAKKELFFISKGNVTQRIALLLNVNEDKLIQLLQGNSAEGQPKVLLISIMKYTYVCIHDFILKKIKSKLGQMFDNKPLRYIHLVDFPGQVDNQTLGGMTLNFANECLNLYSMTNYTSVLSQIEEQKIKLKQFKTPLSYEIVKAFLRSIFPFLSKNGSSLRELISFRNETVELNTKKAKLSVSYTSGPVDYDYTDLNRETQTLIVPNAVLRLLMNSKMGLYSLNPINSSSSVLIPISEYIPNKIRYLLCGLESVEPFVVYCIHSNNSYLDYFNQHSFQLITNPKEEEVFLTRSLLFENISRSIVVSALHWEWNGYEEWIDLKTFADDFSLSYETILEFVRSKKESRAASQEQAMFHNQKFSNEEICRKVISLFSLENECLIGSKYLLMKKNGYQSLRKVFNNLLLSLPNATSSKNTPSITKKNSKAKGQLKGQIKSLPKEQSQTPFAITNHNYPHSQCNQLNKIIYVNIIDQGESSNRNTEHWLDNQYNIDNILKQKQFNELNCNEDTNQLTTAQRLSDVNNKDKPNDINAFIPFILLIQKRFKGFFIRKKVTQMFNYLKHNLVIIQSYARGYLLRVRFFKFIDSLKHIILIQIFYKVRYDKKKEACIKLQKQWRRNLNFIKAQKALKMSKSNHLTKNIISISPSVSALTTTKQKDPPITKAKAKELAKQLENETDKDIIVDSILHNSLLSNETKLSHYNLYRSIHQSNWKASHLSNYSEEKLEDRLLQYGRNLRLRQLKTVSTQMELNLKQYPFKPQLNDNTKLINRHITKSFNERCEDYEKKRRNNLEKIKERIPDEEKTNCTFKPQINDNGMKRQLNDLFIWKELVNKEKDEYRKQYKEQNELNCQLNEPFIDDRLDFSNNNVLRHHYKKYKSKQKNLLIKAKDEKEEDKEDNGIYIDEDTSSMRDVWPINLQNDYILDSC